MERKIRYGVFETNSSSTHNISITSISSKKMLDISMIPDDEGYIILRGGQFGWEWEQHNDALTKANYCAIDQYENKENLQMLKDVIKEQTGAKDVIISVSKDWKDNFASHIDHQSEGTSSKAFKDEDSLRNFIFGKNSWLFTGNDNAQTPPNFYDVTNPEIKYKYELKIEGFDLVEKFAKKPIGQTLKDAISRIMEQHPACSSSFSYWPNSGFDFVHYGFAKNVDTGEKFSSYDKIKSKKIVLFKKETVYSNDKARKWLGDKIKDTCILSFEVREL